MDLCEQFERHVRGIRAAHFDLSPRLAVSSADSAIDALDDIFTRLVREIQPRARCHFQVAPISERMLGVLNVFGIEIRGTDIAITFDEALPRSKWSRGAFNRLIGVMFLIAMALRARSDGSLRVLCEVGDICEFRSIGFSSSVEGAFLVPDANFVTTFGYRAFRAAAASQFIDFDQRETKLIWRGSATGLHFWEPLYPDWSANSWLQRLDVCHRIHSGPHAGACDVGITSVSSLSEDRLIRQIETSGQMKPPIEKLDWMRSKFVLDIDGRSNAWTGLFEGLLLGGCVLKIGSRRHFRQWYYDRLIPWRHYVPVAADLSDLNEMIGRCLGGEIPAAAIAREARALALTITFDAEVETVAARLADLLENDSAIKDDYADVARTAFLR